MLHYVHQVVANLIIKLNHHQNTKLILINLHLYSWLPCYPSVYGVVTVFEHFILTNIEYPFETALIHYLIITVDPVIICNEKHMAYSKPQIIIYFSLL